jgi:hypothetical protein
VASTEIEPCIYRGSLLTNGPLYSLVNQLDETASLEANGSVQLDRLELPSPPGNRAKVVVRSPIQMEVYIDEETYIMQLDKRVEVVPGHVWLDPGTDVHVSSPSYGTAELRMKFAAGTMPPEFVTPVPCADLKLKQGYRELLMPTGNVVYLRPERISIHESAAGPEIAAISGTYLACVLPTGAAHRKEARVAPCRGLC